MDENIDQQSIKLVVYSISYFFSENTSVLKTRHDLCKSLESESHKFLFSEKENYSDKYTYTYQQ